MGQFLDITRDVCPLTFVKVKLRLERLAPGEVLDVRLNAGEPLENVPRATAELGHSVEFLGAEDPGGGGVHRLRIRKSGS